LEKPFDQSPHSTFLPPTPAAEDGLNINVASVIAPLKDNDDMNNEGPPPLDGELLRLLEHNVIFQWV